jgi:anti-sigma B factor antagonist
VSDHGVSGDRVGGDAVAVEIVRVGDVSVASVRGDVDLATAAEIEWSLLEALDASGALVVDLTATGYLDSAALAALHRVWLHSRDADGRVRVVAGDESFGRRILAITGLDGVLILAPSVGEAVSAIAGASGRDGDGP